MTAFGEPKFVNLDTVPEYGTPSYVAQVEAGTRRDTRLGRWRYLLRANYAYNYINLLRKHSNHPAYQYRVALIERFLKHPLYTLLPKTARAEQYLHTGFYMAQHILNGAEIDAFYQELVSQPAYYDPYIPGFKYVGPPEQAVHPFLYIDSDALFFSHNFLALAANQTIINFSQEALGHSAALTWAWAWLSQPSNNPYQNQNWHRDNSEPLNYIRIFIPLDDIVSTEDGPTEIIPETARLADCYEVRRFSDEEVAPYIAKKGQVLALCRKGDVYFVNTFALHRGTPPHKRRAMLTLLVSLSPSHRTPSIPIMRMDSLSPELQDRVRANRRFFRYVVEDI